MNFYVQNDNYYPSEDLVNQIYKQNTNELTKFVLDSLNQYEVQVPVFQNRTTQIHQQFNLLNYDDTENNQFHSETYQYMKQRIEQEMTDYLKQTQSQTKVSHATQLLSKLSNYEKYYQIRCSLFMLFFEVPQITQFIEKMLNMQRDNLNNYQLDNFTLSSLSLQEDREYSIFYLYDYYWRNKMSEDHDFQNIYNCYFKQHCQKLQYQQVNNVLYNHFQLIDVKTVDEQYICTLKSKQYDINVSCSYYEYALAQSDGYKLFQLNQKLIKSSRNQNTQKKQQQVKETTKQKVQHPQAVNRIKQFTNEFYKVIQSRGGDKDSKQYKNQLILANIINTNLIFDLDWFYQFITDFSDEFLHSINFYFEDLQQKAGYGLEYNLIAQPMQMILSNIRSVITQNLVDTDLNSQKVYLAEVNNLQLIDDKQLYQIFDQLAIQDKKIIDIRNLLVKCIYQNKQNCIKLNKDEQYNDKDLIINHSKFCLDKQNKTLQEESQILTNIKNLTPEQYQILLDQSINCNELPNENIYNLAVLQIKLINFYQKINYYYKKQIRKHFIDMTYSGFYRSFNFINKCDNINKYENQYIYIQKWKNSLHLPQLLEAKQQDVIDYLDSLSQPYNHDEIAISVLKQSMEDQQYRLNADNYFAQLPLSSLYNDTYKYPLLIQNIIDPSVQQEVMATQKLQISNLEQYEQADILTCKDDSKIVKLKQYQHSYKFTPEDQYQKYKEQNQDRFDCGDYQNDAYTKQPEPQTFKQTMQMANSVLNRGEVFIIPFMSAANQVQVNQQKDDEQSPTTEDSKTTTTQLYSERRSTSSLIQNNYMRFGGLSGCEGQIIHIEEEEQCFCLFKQRANALLKIFVEWMATYEPQMLTFFDFSTSVNQAQGAGDTTLGNQYRKRYAKQNGLYSTYFEQLDVDQGEQDLLHVQDNSQDSSDESQDSEMEIQIADYPWSQKFDNDLLNIYQWYKSTQNNADRYYFDDSFYNGSASPLIVLPFSGQIKNMPAPPYIPIILQVFLTQFYTTGQIMTNINQNPLITIPIVTRTLSQYLSQLRQAEQRCDMAHRNLFGNLLYRSFDFKTTYLQDIEKKFNNQKQILLDVQRRVQDWYNGKDPQDFQCCCDFNLPKEYVIVQGSDNDKFEFTGDVQPVKLTPIALQQLTDYSLDQKQTQVNKYILRKLTSMVQNDPEIYNSKKELKQYQDLDIQFQQCDLYVQENLLYSTNLSVLKSMRQLKEAQAAYIKTIPKHESGIQQIPQQYKLSVYSDDCIMLKEFMEEMIKISQEQDENNLIRYIPDEDQPDQLYSEQYYGRLVQLVKYLKCDQEHQKMLRKTLDYCNENNILIKSLVQDTSQFDLSTVKEIHVMPSFKSCNYFYASYPQISLQACSIRGLIIARLCLFNEQIPDDDFIKIVQCGLTAEQAMNYIQDKFEYEKRKAIQEIALKSQKSVQISALNQLQQECARKHIFDDIILPLLIQDDRRTTVRLLDDELYCILRQTAMLATRIEYCLRVLENLSSYEKQEAKYGTRTMDPLALSWLNQQNIGVSVFGNDQIQETYEKLTAKFNKYAIQSLPLYVSTRVLKGLLYSSLLNLTQKSVSGCTDGNPQCPFCGGIGAGLNDSITGNVKLDSKYIKQNDYEGMGIDSINGAIEQIKDHLCPIVSVENNSFRFNGDNQIFQQQKENINLIYFLKNSIGKLCKQGTYTQLSKKLLQTQFPKATQIKDEDELADYITQLTNLDSVCIYSRYYGLRLEDTALMLPRPDCYTLEHLKSIDSPFVKEYLDMSQSLVYPLMSPIDSMHLGPTPDINSAIVDKVFKNRKIINYIFNPIVVPQLIVNWQVFRPDQYVEKLHVKDNLVKFYHLLQYYYPNQKETYIQDQAYGIFGLQAYVFTSLKRLISYISKKIENLGQKVINYHADLIQFTYYRAQKTTIESTSQLSLILYDIYCQTNNILGEHQIKLLSQFTNILKNSQINIYWCKKTGKTNVLELQQIELEQPK